MHRQQWEKRKHRNSKRVFSWSLDASTFCRSWTFTLWWQCSFAILSKCTLAVQKSTPELGLPRALSPLEFNYFKFSYSIVVHFRTLESDELKKCWLRITKNTKNTCRYATKYSNTALLNQAVATGRSNNCTVVHWSTSGNTCIVSQILEFAAYALLLLYLPFTVLSANVLNSGGLAEEVVGVIVNDVLRSS